MLNGIPKIISPELMKVLMEMGHGDEIVIADGNFPSATNAQRLVRCDGHNTIDLLKAILQFFPLDSYSDQPVSLMEVVKGDSYEPTIWKEYEEIIGSYDKNFQGFGYIERFSFYQTSKKAYAVIATSEESLYANIILRKGVVTD